MTIITRLIFLFSGLLSCSFAWAAIPTYYPMDVTVQAMTGTTVQSMTNITVYPNPPSLAASLIGPVGETTEINPTYQWNSVATASSYHLIVNDNTGAGNEIDQWYPADEVGCSPDGICQITPSTPVSGNVTWKITAKNNAGNGPVSDTMSFSVGVTTPPGKATLTTPSGNITDTTPSYTWNAVGDSTWYYLWVNDASGNVIKKWYSATTAGCSSGTGTCSVTPSTTLSDGNHTWWIQTYSSVGYGAWSNSLSFSISSSSPPGKATLTTPSGIITDTTPSYTWNAVSDSTWYYLWVNDASGNVIKKWYSATAAGCSSGTGTCSVTPSTTLSDGNHTWWIQTYSSVGYGAWSNSLSFSISSSSPPGKATLTTPSGIITDTTPSYTWNAVSDSTWYYLWVNDASGNVIKKWYSATAAGCSSGTGTCSVTPSTTLNVGNHTWWIQTYNTVGYGAWSNGLNFTIP